MNRLQKKCLIASGALHGLLLLILVFGAALMPEDKVSPATRITFFDPSKVTDGPTRGGGSPQPDQAQPPVVPVAQPQPPVSAPVQPQPPQPIQPPQPQRQVTPQFTPAPTKDAESFKPVKPKPAQTDDFTPVDHPPVKVVASNNNAAADARAKAAADAQRRLANQIKNGINHLSGTVGKDSAVQVDQGQDSGEAAANYRDIVYTMYYQAWNQPASLDNNSVTVLVTVTIARDGRVTHHEITKPSGNPIMDRSVDNTLNNVTILEPFPEGSKDIERTFRLSFSPTGNK